MPSIEVVRENNFVVLKCDSKRTAKEVEKRLKKAYENAK